MDRSDRLLPDDAVREVLSRAAELDSNRGLQMSVGELTRVAQEAGISVGSLQQALVELDQTSPGLSRPHAEDRGTRGRLVRLLATAIAFVGVACAAFFVDDGRYQGGVVVSLLAILVLSIAVALVAAFRRGSRKEPQA